MAPPVHESVILKPKKPSIIDNNEWPDFRLSQVDVYDGVTGVPTSLLFADADNPLTVVGKIEKLPNDRLGYLLERASLPATIRIDNVHTFSYGQYEEGKVALWAAGEAGWFELKPSRAYKPVFTEMVEAVNTLYFTADYYRDITRSKLKSTPAEIILEMFAEEPSNNCQDVAHASSIFRKHIRFLLASMRNGKEGIAWKQTQIFKFLEREDSRSLSPENGTTLEQTQSSTQTRMTPDAERSFQSGRGKSILRLRSDRLSMKGAGRLTSTHGDGYNIFIKEDHDMDRTTSPLKRKSTSQQNERALRRQKRELQTHDSVDDDDAITSDRKIPLLSMPRSSKPSKTDPVPYIKEEPLPSYKPQGPGDTWTCTFDGCIHRIYGATAPASRELIKEHYRGHAVSAQAQMDLVYKEERPYLPVGNLIQKIRAMAAQRNGTALAKQEDGADTSVSMEKKY